MEKVPWKNLESIEGSIEGRFLRPTLLGEHVLPYKLRPPSLSVTPEVNGKVIGEKNAEVEEFQGLAEWLRAAAVHWEKNRTKAAEKRGLDLKGQLDFHGKLASQFPIPEFRVLYSKSGMHVSSMWTRGMEVVDYTLYWAPVGSPAEARFLVAILNSAAVTQAVRPLMSYGKDERHIEKYVWRLPIPTYDPTNSVHQCLTQLAELAEAEVAQLDLQEDKKGFVWQRQQIRKHMAQSEVGKEIETLVTGLLEGPGA